MLCFWKWILMQKDTSATDMRISRAKCLDCKGIDTDCSSYIPKEDYHGKPTEDGIPHGNNHRKK